MAECQLCFEEDPGAEEVPVEELEVGSPWELRDTVSIPVCGSCRDAHHSDGRAA